MLKRFYLQNIYKNYLGKEMHTTRSPAVVSSLGNLSYLTWYLNKRKIDATSCRPNNFYSHLTTQKVFRKFIGTFFVFQNGKLYSVFGLTGKLMTTLYCGAVESVGQVLLQVFTMGLLRGVVVAIMLSFHKIVKDCLKEKQNETPKDK